MGKKCCAIIDYGIGNIFSVKKALERFDVSSVVTADNDKILSADRVILPGVGAFGKATETLRQKGLDDVIKKFISLERPFLGICVGMQVLMQKGHEFGVHEGLGIFEGEVRKIDSHRQMGEDLRVPIIGWHTPVPSSKGRWENTAFDEMAPETPYYFVHSFQAIAKNYEDVAAVVRVGSSSITAAIHKDNVIGVQFHPERSAQGGLNFLSNFLNI